MPRGRPKNLSNYEKTKAKKARDFLSEKSIFRFDKLNDSALLKTVRISDDRIFVSLDYHEENLKKIAEFVNGLKDT